MVELFLVYLIYGPCVLLVDYCDVFISCLDSRFDGTHSLQRIHWGAKEWNATFLQISFAEETNSSTIFSTLHFLSELFL